MSNDVADQPEQVEPAELPPVTYEQIADEFPDETDRIVVEHIDGADLIHDTDRMAVLASQLCDITTPGHQWQAIAFQLAGMAMRVSTSMRPAKRAVVKELSEQYREQQAQEGAGR